MKIGDIVEVSEEQRELLKSGHNRMVVAQAAFEEASNLIEASRSGFWETIKEIVGDDVYEKHHLSYNANDEDNHKLIVAKSR